MAKVYVHATLKIRIGGYERFCAAMAEQVPVLEGLGWKLVGAWTTTIGPICTVIDLWELPDANSFFDANAEWRTTEQFKAFRAVTSEVMVDELVTMVTKVPYSP